MVEVARHPVGRTKEDKIVVMAAIDLNDFGMINVGTIGKDQDARMLKIAIMALILIFPPRCG